MALVALVVAITAAGYWWMNQPPGRYESDNGGLYPIKVGDKYGFMERSGTTVITPQFDEVDEFSERLSAVRVGTKWGYINPTGAIAITPQFDAAQPFRNGRAAVKLCCGAWFSETENDRFGFIDEDGKYIHSPDFLWVGAFTGNLAPVKTSEGSIAFLNKSGKVVMAGKFESASGFSEGLAPVATGGKWGYIDVAGEWVINPQFESASGFADGLAPVVVGGRTGYINKQGRFVINPQYQAGLMFNEGHAVVKNEGTGIGLIDLEGRVVVELGKFQSVGSFRQGLAAVKTEDGWGFIDSTAKMVISPQFDSAGWFHNGLALVDVVGKEAYITASGTFVVDPFPGTTIKQERERIATEARQVELDAQAAAQVTQTRGQSANRDLSCSTEGSARSIGSERKTAFSIVNQRTDSITVYWLDFDGQRKRWFDVPPGQTRSQGETYSTHPWLVADSSGACITIFRAVSDSGANITIP
ncbi:MAG: WG repeat-containing protein [Acidobacteriota bacterium]|nr:WG repeat-containing protein [Acidobacteriota bacterium]